MSDLRLLLFAAGIDIGDVGYKSKGGYVLTRYNDEGPYQLGNCFFRSQKANVHEWSEKKYGGVKPPGTAYGSGIPLPWDKDKYDHWHEDPVAKAEHTKRMRKGRWRREVEI